jgi:hypothetical protein
VQAERQSVLLAHGALVPPAEARCEKSERVFQSKWWGRRTPLEVDPRKITQPSFSHTLDSPRTADGLAVDDANRRVTLQVSCVACKVSKLSESSVRCVVDACDAMPHVSGPWTHAAH